MTGSISKLLRGYLGVCVLNMRQRVTFFQNPGSPVDPASLSITKQTLNGPEIHGIREDRATFALDELPGELRALLERYETLQIRWASKENHESVSPLYSRISPGLHVFCSPRLRNTGKGWVISSDFQGDASSLRRSLATCCAVLSKKHSAN